MYGKGLVGIPVIEHPADNAGSSVRIMLGKSERIGCEILAERDFTRTVRVLFPSFQPFEAFLKRFVADGFGIPLCLFLDRLLEPVFLFLTCRVAPVSGLRKVWRGKIPQRSEDDFSPANPNGA